MSGTLLHLERSGKATYHTGAAVGIPFDGSVFSVRFDVAKSPKRFVLSYTETGKEVDFAYAI